MTASRGSYRGRRVEPTDFDEDEDLDADPDDPTEDDSEDDGAYVARRRGRSGSLDVLPRGFVLTETRSRTGPTDVPGSLRLEQVDEHRNLTCASYDSCLSEAQGWKGFSCRPCTRFRVRPAPDNERFSHREVLDLV